jgi:hypothetical protein
MILFSGHDYTLIDLMSTLGVFESVRRRPVYGSAIIIELHKDLNSSHFVKVGSGNRSLSEGVYARGLL